MRLILGFTRIFVGVLFIFSGLIKANDPMGLSYKMQEFFEIWGMDILNDYTLALSILMIAFEIIAGVAVLVGWQFQLFSWMLFLLIIFFTFLTGYAVLSGKIKECGCFGDCIKLKADQSFAKDLILLVMTGFLLYNRKSINAAFSKTISVAILLLVTISSFGLQFYVLRNLPIVDCLPYKVGLTIQEQMKIPPGAIPDSSVITFVYSKQGKEVEFDAEHFPADFNDSLYTFVKRYDKLIREGNAKPPIKDFVIISPSGNDTTQSILNDPETQWILFAKSFDYEHEEWINDVRNYAELSYKNNIRFMAVTSDADGLIELFSKNAINIPIMKGDLVAIKTAARSNPTLYHLKKGKIIAKYGKADLKGLDKQFNSKSKE
jgi:uncharacterized membrane protein YphA (DoxX/SURF4 family)